MPLGTILIIILVLILLGVMPAGATAARGAMALRASSARYWSSSSSSCCSGAPGQWAHGGPSWTTPHRCRISASGRPARRCTTVPTSSPRSFAARSSGLALVGLLTIAVIAVLYVARTLFMPIVTAFVIGTMLSAGHRVSRALSDSAGGVGGADVRHELRDRRPDHRTDLGASAGMDVPAPTTRRPAQGETPRLRPSPRLCGTRCKPCSAPNRRRPRCRCPRWNGCSPHWSSCLRR